MAHKCELEFICHVYDGISSLKAGEESPVHKCSGYKPNMDLSCAYKFSEWCGNKDLQNMVIEKYIIDHVTKQYHDAIFGKEKG